ncbi:MAG: DUF1697 domain-containing protein [Polyangiaceae bacterium]
MATKKSDGGALLPCAVLLRGVNLGGNRLSMKELVSRLTDSGLRDVRTYIQSGNVVLRASGKQLDGLASLVEKLILDEFGLKVPATVRTRDELAQVVKRNPFLKLGKAPESLHVAFLADAPSAASVEALDPTRSSPDEFRVVGREVFLHLPNGMAKTKLTNAYFDAKLGTMSTARNWRTVLTLLDMLSDG